MELVALLHALGDGAARLNATTFKTRVIVGERSRIRLDCQYQNVVRIDWYLGHSLITSVTHSHKSVRADHSVVSFVLRDVSVW